MYENGIQSDECKPLDDLKIPHLKDGVLKQVPALHEGWVRERCYLHYIPPPQPEADSSFTLGAKQDWLDHMEYFCDDLEWLLHLEQHRFWSQMVYDRDTMEMILSYLQEGIPFYAIHEFPDDKEMWSMYQKVYHLVFLVINRLATHTESKTNFMTRKLLGELVYNNYIFTIPVVIDLCLLYGRENRTLLMQVIDTVFEVQPHYHSDLVKSVAYFTQALLGVAARLDVRTQSTAEIPTKLTNHRNVLTLDRLQDLILHVLDTAMSVSTLLDIYTPACTTFHKQLFELRIVSFYENTIPEMYRKLEALANKDDSQEIYVKLKMKLDIARVELLKAFHYMLSSCINSVLENKDDLSAAELKSSVDEYVSVLSECLTDKRFVRDYYRKYPLGPDLDMLAQLCPEMDTMKSDYLLEAALACFDVPPHKKHNTCKPFVRAPPRPKAAQSTGEAKKQQISGVRLESLITQVKDVLPHLGDGFVESCLEYYGYVSDAVLNAVLEDQLPPELQTMDYTMPRIPSGVMESELAEGMDGLSVREEEEDELDNVDHASSHKGKRKGPYRDMRQMLNDKTHRTEFRELYARLGVVDSVDNMYDDEYDDTYDHLDVSVGDEGDLERRPFVVPRVLRPKEESGSSGDEVEVDGGGDESGPPRDQFVPNPEELRAAAERRRLARHPQQPKSRDVIGKPKGQGQDKQVVVNRTNKTVHKVFRGNHNRRTGAQRKRQQGMMPS